MNKSTNMSLMIAATLAMAWGGTPRPRFDDEYQERKRDLDAKYGISSKPTEYMQECKIKRASLRRELKELKRTPKATRDTTRVNKIVKEIKRLKV